MGPSRHLALLPELTVPSVKWPVPFADGISKLLEMRGKNVVVFASGDPFWFGAGSVFSRHLAPDEWQAFPGISCFALMANRLGWSLENTKCLGLHAAPMSRLRPILSNEERVIVTLRDGEAVKQLCKYLNDVGFGQSEVYVGQALGGPAERVSQFRAHACDGHFAHPLCAAIALKGDGALPLCTGKPDTWFANDGQITKRPVRALALSALAPQKGEVLWDIGGGSGSIAIEWLLHDASLRAVSVEKNSERAAVISQNALDLGVDRLTVMTGSAPEALDGLPTPDAIFIGGGLSRELIAHLQKITPVGTRIVAHAVTLESEAILAETHARLGGELMRIELSHAKPLGRMRGWSASYPIVQWGVTL